jgi:hypothetical protein
MIISDYARKAFNGYLGPLAYLEQSFTEAGLDVVFRGIYTANGGKRVVLRNGRSIRVVSIEGDSPAQAVKDVAEKIKL